MQPEFSIRSLKKKEVNEVISTIEAYTSGDISEFILSAFENEDLESYVNALNSISYLAMKTILILNSQVKILKKENKKFTN